MGIHIGAGNATQMTVRETRHGASANGRTFSILVRKALSDLWNLWGTPLTDRIVLGVLGFHSRHALSMDYYLCLGLLCND